MNDETAFSFLVKCLKEEILPTVGENDESISFAKSVLDRFRNPFIKHKWRAISLNSVSKFSVRVLPTILEYKEKFGEYPKCLVLSLAYLIYFYKNDTPDDMTETVLFIKNSSVADILKNTSFWSVDLSLLTDEVSEYYRKIHTFGAKEVMKWILSE